MSLADRATRAAQGARQMAAALRRQIKALLTPWRAARRLFLDPATNMLTPDAVTFFRMIDRAGFVSAGAWHADAREHAYREGRRALALSIMRMTELDQPRLAALLAQADDDDEDAI